MKKTNIRLVSLILIIICTFFVFGGSRKNYNSGACPDWMWNWAYAHKGIHKDENIDENSMSAFIKAIESGYAIELDLRYTKDRIPMVCHDNDLSDEVGENIRLSDITFEQAKKLQYIYSGEHIASFEEVLSFVDGRVPLLIDVKSFLFPGTFEENIVDLLSKYTGPYAIQSFSPFTLNFFRKLDPDITIGLLLDDIPGIPIARSIRILKDNLFSYMCHPNFIIYNVDRVTSHELDIYRDKDHIVLGYLYSEDDIRTQNYKVIVDGIIFE